MITEINLTPTSVQFEIPRPGGSSILARSWGNASDCKAVALLVHGLGAHSGWFEAFARQLNERRVFAVSYDLVGFGRSRTQPFSSYTQWIDDLVLVFSHMKRIYPGKPVYLIGNSMGALLSLVAAARGTFASSSNTFKFDIEPDGLVLLSPGFDGCPDTFTLFYRATTVVKALLNPEGLVALPYGADLCTRDVPTRTWINNDPEGSFRVAGKYLLQLLKLSNATKHTTRTIKSPVLMMTSGKDRIVNNPINYAFFKKLSAPEKKHKHFEEAWHDLMFDPQLDEVADEILHWMSEHSVEKLING